MFDGDNDGIGESDGCWVELLQKEGIGKLWFSHIVFVIHSIYNLI